MKSAKHAWPRSPLSGQKHRDRNVGQKRLRRRTRSVSLSPKPVKHSLSPCFQVLDQQPEPHVPARGGGRAAQAIQHGGGRRHGVCSENRPHPGGGRATSDQGECCAHLPCLVVDMHDIYA